METVFAYILESTTLQRLASLQSKEEKIMTVIARDALNIHKATILRMEVAVKEAANLRERLTEERKTRDHLIRECDELKRQATRDNILVTNVINEANEHIKKQDDEIVRLQVEKAGDGVPSYQTMKKNFIEAITKIELYKVRLANCGYWAKLVLGTNPSHVVGKELEKIIKESKGED